MPPDTADAGNAADGRGDGRPPDTQPAGDQVERQLRVVEVGGKLHCELTLLNPSRSRITIPRYPRSLSISSLDIKGEDLGGGGRRLSGHRSRLFRDPAQLVLGPGEGYIKRLAFDRPPPGRYRLTLKMREGFEQLEPAPVTFEVKARQPAQSRPSWDAMQRLNR